MTNNKKRGDISILSIFLLGVIIIFVLSYFDISIKKVVEAPQTQENLQYVGGAGKSFWQKYLKGPAHYLWQDVWVDIFWKSFILNMERIRDGKPTDLDEAANNLKVKY